MNKSAYEVGHGGVIFEAFDEPKPKPILLTDEEKRVFKALGLSEVMTDANQLVSDDGSIR